MSSEACRAGPSRLPSPGRPARAVLVDGERPAGPVNLVVGYVLVGPFRGIGWKDTGDARALGAGILPLALFSARHFGRLHGDHAPGQA